MSRSSYDNPSSYENSDKFQKSSAQLTSSVRVEDRRLSSFVDESDMTCSPDGNVNGFMCKLKAARWHCREFLGEMLGTWVLIMFGNGVCAQEFLYQQPTNVSFVAVKNALANGDTLDVSNCDAVSSTGQCLMATNNPSNPNLFAIHTGWFLGVTLGIYICGGVTGAHLNPAVTITLAFWRKFSWKKVPVYIAAQLVGAFLAAACVFWVYRDAFDAHGKTVPATAGVFATYPAGHAGNVATASAISNWPSFVDEFFGTFLLLLIIFAVNDQNNLPPGSNLAPIIVGWIVWAIGVAFGIQTGYAINPARDFGPRLFSYFAGWGTEVFSYGDYYFWIPIVAPVVGGVFGGLVYDIFIVTDKPSNVDE